MTLRKRILWPLVLLLCMSASGRNRFYNLTADEVKTDTLLPRFACSMSLQGQWQDSVYVASVVYPEFIDMPKADIAQYKKLSATLPNALPELQQAVVMSRKEAHLEVSFCPVVYREERYRLLVSFMISVQSAPKSALAKSALGATRAPKAAQYAEHSVLSAGKWAKIRVSETGVYALTEDLIKRAGFSDLAKIKVYGSGGELRSEVVLADELARHDDLKEVPTCAVGGKRLFYGRGTVSWKSSSETLRTRNPYANYGYYFITESGEKQPNMSQEEFLKAYYPLAKDFHSLHEVDNFAWMQGGRNLFEDDPITAGKDKEYALKTPGLTSEGTLMVGVSAGSKTTYSVSINGKTMGTHTIDLVAYDAGNGLTRAYKVDNLKADNSIKVSVLSGGPVRLDFISATFDRPWPAPALQTAVFPVPEYVGQVANQDRHSDAPADMIIIIPTSKKLLSQAQRIARYHEEKDQMRVRIVTSGELINEFSGGTPDAAAYRNYLKMLYDRANTVDDAPKYLLLFGDGVWDNRMLTPACRGLNADDYLLCYESEDSFNDVDSYVDDGFFGLLDEGEGAPLSTTDKLDVAIGRLPVSTEEAAKVVVDKILAYKENANAGAWQGTICFMGDDGDENTHMTDVNDVADKLSAMYPNYLVKKIFWDAYTRRSSATGNTYPDVTEAIKRQQKNGALIMDYGGHGSATQISHEMVVGLPDFEEFRNRNLPMWVTASCDILPFDGTMPNIGEAAILNPRGGAVALFGSVRTVYTNYNKMINQAFLTEVLKVIDGKPISIGEAQRRAKNSLQGLSVKGKINMLQYSLLGDPAMTLNLPTLPIVLDSINGKSLAQGSSVVLKAGTVARISGHVDTPEDFKGVVTATVRDAQQLVTCKLNDPKAAEKPFSYRDYAAVLFSGTDSVRANKFTISFVVPKDISYVEGNGVINLYAVSTDHALKASGVCDKFTLAEADGSTSSTQGPSIYCYLNSPSFTNGGAVNATPFFVAKVQDEDGVNATGNGIGHDLRLIIDGDVSKTYLLNDNFMYDFGSHTSGMTTFNIPELAPGPHKLQFKAWDAMNNSSTVELNFTVVKGLGPELFSVGVTRNPASETTTFIINHDRTGSKMEVDIDVFDLSGRLLWKHKEAGVPDTEAYTVDWNLTADNGGKLQTGVYLYRVAVASDGSKQVSKARKLIVMNNN